MVRDMGVVSAAVVGDYKLGFGEGLVINNGGFATGKTALMNKPSQGIRAKRSMDEVKYLRGAAATLQFGEVKLITWLSYRRLDASRNNDGTVKTIQTSGLHTTLKELEEKRNLATTVAGGNVTWSSSNTSVATVSSTGLVTSVAYGSATITATAGSVSAMCSVVVAQATCTGITATYTQSGTVYYNTNLDALKSDLVVTASWSDGTTTTLNASDYTLSGTLVEGTSTITVSYGGQTDTFSVTVAPYYYPMTITDTSDGVGFGPIDKTKNTMIPPYVASSSNHRLHCIGDNIGYPVNYGKTYKVTIQDATTTVGIVATCFNQAGKSQLENIQAVSSTNSNETTWLDVDNQTFTFTPTLINGTEPVCMWLVFRRSSENARWKAVTDMTPITIEELDGE
jgi:hypothetical protein